MLKELTEKLIGTLPSDIGDEVRNNLKSVVNQQFEKMELVTREQLAVQQKILARTREKVGELEQALADLEQRLENKD